MTCELYQSKLNVKVAAQKEKNKSILESILDSRGITNKDEYFSSETLPLASPYLFSDMEKAEEILSNAIKNQDKILIWGDFDADGVTSTAILYKTFQALGANFTYFIPDRVNLGHGINLGVLLKLISKEKIKVLITVDCGISNIKEIQLLKTMGIKVIVTDHHEVQALLPNADCILNPLAKNSLKQELPFKIINDISYLSGAGVAFNLARALIKDDNEDLFNELLVLASVGTMADVVPLKGENRKIAAQGLKKINEGCHSGISRLFKKLEIEREIKSYDITFLLAPRINSAGRLSTPDKSFRLLVEENKYAVDNAISELEELNKQRQNYCDSTYEQALSMLSSPSECIVLYNPDWIIGVIGIVASKLVEKFNLPVFLITKDKNNMYRCSARGIQGVDISKVLASLKDLFTGFGGHLLAGGFSADSNSVSFDDIKRGLTEAVVSLSDTSPDNGTLIADMELDGDDISFELIEEIEKMEPFGAENERPKFLFKNAKVSYQRTIGKDLNHLAYGVIKDDCEFNCLYWKRKLLGFNQGELIDFIFRLEINEFNGEEKIQLITESIVNDKMHDKYFLPVKIFDHRQKAGILDKVEEYVKNKNGEVKIWAPTVQTKKYLERYPYIKSNILSDIIKNEKTLMLFDYPANFDELKRLIKETAPKNLHIMNTAFSKNPDEYITLLTGMLKYSSNNKNGNIDIIAISRALGLDEQCTQIALELFEKIGAIQILDIDKVAFLKPPALEVIHNDSLFDILKDEIKRVIDFKEYLKTIEMNTLQELLKK